MVQSLQGWVGVAPLAWLGNRRLTRNIESRLSLVVPLARQSAGGADS